MISLDLLRLFVTLGMIVTKVHKVYEFRQEAIFKSYIEKNIELRKNSSEPHEKDNAKLMSNSVYGKTFQDPRKNQIITKLVTSKNHFKKLACNPLLKESFPISESQLIMRFLSQRINFNSPLPIGWFVLEKSKKFMYDIYYNKLKRHYKDKISLIYGDTDSFLIKIDGCDDIYEEMARKPLKDIMDFSNLPKEHVLYSDANKGVLGKLKSECGVIPISEVVCLAPKSYSVLLDDGTTKSTCKGVKKHLQKNFRHEKYREILNGDSKPNQVVYNEIRTHKNELRTIRSEKRALTPRDIKRYHVSKHKSYGYGHPEIAKIHSMNSTENVVKPTKKRKNDESVNEDQELKCNLTYKRAKCGHELYK